MLGAALLASLLAQAVSPAYAVPERPGEAPPRAPVDDLPVDASNTLGIQGRFAYRLPGQAPMLGAAGGYSVGASFEHRYGNLTPDVEVGVALDLFYDRFASQAQVPTLNAAGMVVGTMQAERFLFHTSFAALQMIGLHIGPTRLFAGAGGGVAIGFLSDPVSNVETASSKAVQPIARACVGADVQLRGRMGLMVRVDYTYPLTNPGYGSYQPFGDQFDAGAGAVYRF